MSESHDHTDEKVEDLDVAEGDAEDVKGGQAVAGPPKAGKAGQPTKIFDDPFFFDVN